MCLIDQTNARALDAGDLDLRLRLALGSARDVLDGQRPAHHVEGHLAMARLVAVAADSVEGGLDFGDGAMLCVEVEAEPSARGKHGKCDQADQDSLHSQLQLLAL